MRPHESKELSRIMAMRQKGLCFAIVAANSVTIVKRSDLPDRWTQTARPRKELREDRP